jgi:O-antigen/teichoic acid export membrane protein
MTGHHRDTIRVYAVAAATDVVLNLLLIPMLGIVGAALASQLALLGASVALCVLVRRRLGLDAFIHPVGAMKES